jgi:hypothetical protein
MEVAVLGRTDFDILVLELAVLFESLVDSLAEQDGRRGGA